MARSMGTEVTGPSDDDLISEAIAQTEQEIFSEASGAEEPDYEDDDRSLESMESVDGDEESPEDDAVEDEDDETPVEEPGDEPAEVLEPHQEDSQASRGERLAQVPSGRLREEIANRQRAEAERDALRAQIETANARLTALEQLQPTSAQPEAPKGPPDMFADPEGYTKWVREEARNDALNAFREEQRRAQEARVEASLQAASRGDRAPEFAAAYSRLTALDPKDPANQATVQRIINSSDPAAAVFDWWEANGAEQYREAIIAQAEQLLGRPLRSNPRMPNRAIARQSMGIKNPPSLNERSGSSTHRDIDPEMYNGSEESIFNYAARR